MSPLLTPKFPVAVAVVAKVLAPRRCGSKCTAKAVVAVAAMQETNLNCQRLVAAGWCLRRRCECGAQCVVSVNVAVVVVAGDVRVYEGIEHERHVADGHESLPFLRPTKDEHHQQC